MLHCEAVVGAEDCAAQRQTSGLAILSYVKYPIFFTPLSSVENG